MLGGGALAASLKTGMVAILGGGIDHLYPPQHARLNRGIAERGLIVSERPAGCKARAQDFPRRNRLITGRARGTVVVVAAERSGSLLSARMSGGQGREVMTVPGSPLGPRRRHQWPHPAGRGAGAPRAGWPIDEIVWPPALNLRNARQC